MITCIILIFNHAPKLNNQSLLAQIKADGQLVVITRNSPTTYYEEADGPAGLEYEMAKMFADELGVERFSLTQHTQPTTSSLVRSVSVLLSPKEHDRHTRANRSYGAYFSLCKNQRSQRDYSLAD